MDGKQYQKMPTIATFSSEARNSVHAALDLPPSPFIQYQMHLRQTSGVLYTSIRRSPVMTLRRLPSATT